MCPVLEVRTLILTEYSKKAMRIGCSKVIADRVALMIELLLAELPFLLQIIFLSPSNWPIFTFFFENSSY